MHDFYHHWRNTGLRVITLYQHRETATSTDLITRPARSHWCLWLMIAGRCQFRLPQGSVELQGPAGLLIRPEEGYQQQFFPCDDGAWWAVADFEVLTLPGWPDPLQSLIQPAMVHFQHRDPLTLWAQQLPRTEEHAGNFLLRPAVDQALGLLLSQGFASEQLHLASGSMPRWLMDLRRQLGQPTLLHDPQLSLSSIARLAGLPKSQLCQAFRRHMGCSPMAWLRRERLTNACRLLRNDESQPIADIAAACGYRSPNLFARHFRALMG
ncbi:MAG: AraC family transcriptional regulator, partial [Planctomycetota bacterium]